MKRLNYSVIIPHRNSAAFLRRAIESIPQRDDIEVLVVDNSTQEVDLSFVNGRTRLLSSEPSRGAGGARNVGIENAKGRFLLFLDADDRFLPKAWTLFDKYLETDQDMAFFKMTSVNWPDGSLAERHVPYNRLLDLHQESGDRHDLSYLLRMTIPVAKMISRSFVASNAIEFEEVEVSNDVLFALKVTFLAESLAVDGGEVYEITSSSGSLTAVKSKERAFTRFQVLAGVYQWLTDRGGRHYAPILLTSVIYSLRYGPAETCKYVSELRKMDYRLFNDIRRRLFLRK